ncbi:MAG: anti-sigma factor domain-containing protein [Acidimicrobiales bacterium]
MTHDEIEEMLGVYALDALDAPERQEIDDHLASCPRCRAELAAHREVAALLGSPVGETPATAPEQVWDRIASVLQDVPPALPPLARRGPRRSLALFVSLGAVAAGLILVVALLAAKVGNLSQQVSSLRHQAGVTSVLLDPSHRTVELTSATHPRWRATVVISASGEGYLINPSMPPLTGSQTFQLWALSRGKVVSLGVLGSHPAGAPIRVQPTMTVLMINAEPLGGTPVPTTPVLVQANLPVGS